MYLANPIEIFEYMKMAVELISHELMDIYQLQEKVFFLHKNRMKNIWSTPKRNIDK